MINFQKIYGKFTVSFVLIKGIKNWIPVFANYLGILNNNYVTHKLRNGLVIKIKKPEKQGETSGLANIFEIFLIKNYNPKGMEIKNGDTIIDIGANIGMFTLYASLLSQRGKVYSYEPFPIHFERMLNNIKLNGLKNVVPFNLAVSESNKKRGLNISDVSSGMHSFFFKGSGKKVYVGCTTLKEIFDINNLEKCDFLKLDCEGSEYEILYNAPKKYLDKIEKMALEWDNLDNEKMNINYLKKFLRKNEFKIKVKGEKNKAGILYAKR